MGGTHTSVSVQPVPWGSLPGEALTCHRLETIPGIPDTQPTSMKAEETERASCHTEGEGGSSGAGESRWTG